MRTDNRNRPSNNIVRHIINDRIKGTEFRVLDDQGEQIGVMSREEALAVAKEREVDLVLIGIKAVPQVVKVIDYHKFLYQEEKKTQESRKGQKKSGTKDIQLSLFIGEGDLTRLKDKTHEFLAKGYQVRVKMPLRGREVGKKPMAIEMVQKFIASLGEVIIAVEPRLQGRVVLAILARKK